MLLDTLFIELLILVLLIIIARTLYEIHKVTNGLSQHPCKKRSSPAKTLICIGSGGHTTEMLTLVKNLDFRKYNPRYYIIANSDITSTLKVQSMEKENNDFNYFIKEIPRSRHVGQSYISSVITTLYSIAYCIPLLIKIRPDLILCNGPGTCIPICIISFVLKIMFIANTRIVFIESFCRTKTLSLTGKILIYIADNILVQWPSLKKKLKRSEYIGNIL